MKLRQIRYNNVQRLVRDAGILKDFADRIGKAPAQCSSFAGSNPRKGIGDAVAEDIERAFGLPSGWLDENRGEQEAQSDHGSDSQFDNYSALIELGKEVRDFTAQEWAEIRAYARLIRARKGAET